MHKKSLEYRGFLVSYYRFILLRVMRYASALPRRRVVEAPEDFADFGLEAPEPFASSIRRASRSFFWL